MNSRYYHYYYHFLETTYTRPKRTTIAMCWKVCYRISISLQGFLGISELWVDKAPSHLRGRPDVENKRTKECRPSRRSPGGVHPLAPEARRQVRAEIPQHQLPELQGGIQVYTQSYHQNRYSSRSACGYRWDYHSSILKQSNQNVSRKTRKKNRINGKDCCIVVIFFFLFCILLLFWFLYVCWYFD